MSSNRYSFSICQCHFLCSLISAVHYLLHPLCYLKSHCMYLRCVHLPYFLFLLSLQSTNNFIICIYSIHITMYTVFVCVMFVGYSHFIRAINIMFLIIILFIRYFVAIAFALLIYYTRLFIH